ncbi:MAG: glycosyltransferase [Syntrophobacteraceae bacterium]|jgi:hypothetical protein
MPQKRFLPFNLDPVLVAILIIAAFLLLYRLDHRPFWQDEAETACLARNVLKYGIPIGFDGVNLVSQEEGREYRTDYVWRWSPWAQIYVAAAAFKVGGLGTTAGRFPFALIGLVSIWLVYFLVMRRFDDIGWARLSALFLTFMVPFLLFSRQCRYYSLGGFLTLVFIFAFRGKWQSRLGPAAALVACMVLLFYTNYLLLFSFAASFAVSALLLYREELPVWRIVWMVIAAAALIIPGLGFYQLGQQSGLMDLTLYPYQFGRYLEEVCRYVVPLPLGVALLWRWRRLLDAKRHPDSPAEKFVIFLSIIIFVSITILALVPQYSFRYLVHLLPLCAIILAWITLQVWQFSRFSAVFLALLLICTNWLHVIPMDLLGMERPPLNDFNMLSTPNIPLRLFLLEINSDEQDSDQGIANFLNAHAQPGDTVMTTYGDLPLQFYTSCRVLGSLQGKVPELARLPDWVIVRHHPGRNRDALLFDSEEYVRWRLRLDEGYKAVALPCLDERYGNIPNPHVHWFLPLSEPFVNVVIHRRQSETAND